MDSGLYLDLDCFFVTWSANGMPGMNPEETWVPLEFALMKVLEMWDAGKCIFGSRLWVTDGIIISSWTAGDLDATLEAWQSLLDALQERLPHPSMLTLSDPLSSEMLNKYGISPFAKAFLSKAMRPRFKFVAPGLMTFSPESFQALTDAEPADAYRRNFARERVADQLEDETPSLILPSYSSTVRHPPADETFDRGWGVGKFTISRRPGLYSGIVYDFADRTVFVTDEGSVDPIKFATERTWGPGRSVSFSEMFGLWADLVRDGTWDIDDDGVATPHSWFTDPVTSDQRELLWTNANR